MPERSVIILSGGGYLVCLALGCLFAVLTAGQLQEGIPEDVGALILATSCGGVLLTTSLVTVILLLTMPNWTSLRNLLTFLPVSRAAVFLGQHVVYGTFAYCLAAALSGAAVGVVIRLDLSLGQTAAAIFCIALAIGLMILFTVAGHRFGCALVESVFRVSSRFSPLLSSIALLGLLLWVIGSDIYRSPTGPMSEGGALFFPHRVIAEVVFNSRLEVLVALVVWVGLVVGLFLGSAALPSPHVSFPTRPLVRLPRCLLERLAPQLWMEALIALRNPYIYTSVLGSLALVGGAWWFENDSLFGRMAALAAQLAPIVPFALTIYATGRTIRFRWLAAQLTGVVHGWRSPKLFGQLLVCAGISSIVLILEAGAGVISAVDPLQLVSGALGLGCIGIVAGTMIPCSEFEPLSVPAAGFLSGVYLFGVNCVGWLAQNIGLNVGVEVFLLVGAGVCCYVFYSVGARQGLPIPGAGEAG